MIEKIDIYIPCFNTMRTLHIYLPQDYQESRKKYPVLYMYDGHNLFHDEDATFGKSWGLEKYLDKQQCELVVVGIECNHEGNQRLIEFSPYTFFEPHLDVIAGRGAELMQWVVDELKPWIDRQYRTKSARQYTGVAGSSMGGLMALYTILHHNETFSKAACLSCYLHHVMGDIRKELATDLMKDTSIYLSWGSDEYRSKTQLAQATKANLEIANTLLSKSVMMQIHQVYRGRHCEACWEKEIPTFLTFLFK